MSAPPPAAKIGLLDSGLGGLSVLGEIHRLLPDCSTIYVADQAHLPYGPRPPSEIDGFVDGIVRFLLADGARIVVLACHAASAASLESLRRRYPDVPFVGIEPAVKPAVEQTRGGVIGVLTTQATADGPLYRRVLDRFATDVRVMTRVSPDLVELVESGDWESDAGRDVVRRAIEPMLDAGADHVVLACTHFSFLESLIVEAAGPNVRLVDPGPAVARQTARLWQPDCEPLPTHRYLTSGSPPRFAEMLDRLLGLQAAVEQARWRNHDGFWELLADDGSLPRGPHPQPLSPLGEG